ncbi:MAG: hypothetical protein E6R03_17865 [Hyphomicrobiaceae bacterium]|nr:MAG: hypothetical protein E6R03_17865 [Hyphomicrobiaceae bacterium]
MSFLTICQEVAQEAGLTGGTLPTNVVNQSGELRRIVDWTRQAWIDIQRQQRSWTFMNADMDSLVPAGAQIVDGLAIAPPVLNVGEWDENSFRVSIPGQIGTEVPLVFMTYRAFRDTYLVGQISVGMPAFITVDRAKKLEWNVVSDRQYRLRGQYKRSLQRLQANDDDPYCSEDYADAIKWKALMYYAQYEEAGSIYSVASSNFRQALTDMRNNCLPSIEWGGPLA